MYENRHYHRTKMEKLDCANYHTTYLHQINADKLLHQVEAQKPQVAQVGMGKPGGGTDTKKRVTTIILDTFSGNGTYVSRFKFIYSKSK
jgi:hypothetical protein